MLNNYAYSLVNGQANVQPYSIYNILWVQQAAPGIGSIWCILLTQWLKPLNTSVGWNHRLSSTIYRHIDTVLQMDVLICNKIKYTIQYSFIDDIVDMPQLLLKIHT